MRGRLLRPLAALGLLALQTSLGGASGIGGVTPDFLLLFVLLAGLRRGETSGTLWGIALGFLQDAFSAGVPGLNVLTKGLAGFVAGGLRDRLDCENPNTLAFVAAAATLAEGAAHLALLQLFSAGRELLAPLLGTVLPAAAANGVLLPAAAALQAVLRSRRERRVARAVA